MTDVIKDLTTPSGDTTQDDIVGTREAGFELEVEFSTADLPGDLSTAEKVLSLPASTLLIEQITVVKKDGTATYFEIDFAKSPFSSSYIAEDIFCQVRDIAYDFSLQRNLTYKSRDGSQKMWVRVKSYCGSLAVKIMIAGKVRVGV